MKKTLLIVVLLAAVAIVVGCSSKGGYGPYYRGSVHYGTGWYQYPRYYRDRPIIVAPGPGLPDRGPIATPLPSGPPMMGGGPGFGGGMPDIPHFGMPDVGINPL